MRRAGAKPVEVYRYGFGGARGFTLPLDARQHAAYTTAVKLSTSIKHAIERSGRPITGIARDVGVSRQTVYGWMDGRKTPRISHVFKLSQILDTPILTVQTQKSCLGA